ncbi:acyltransferase family protein [Edaphobacter aggregans]|uniref:acyltransferase family protein n=1 Tax=Edaphobacter aggregans TaxID=570835 RepID=UPI00068BF73C|nr:acyltransferase [Edaphobacter aggregans]
MIKAFSSLSGDLRSDVNSETKLERFYIPSLDGIRALAFCLVFIAHGWDTHLGMFGVTVFFFLSGFLITTLMRREFELSGSVSLRNFYIRRTLRIFPPLYLTIAFILTLVITHVLNEPVDRGSFLASSTFITNYWIIFKDLRNSGLGSLWSLAVEEHFYLLFPFLFILMNKLALSYKSQARLLGGLCLIFLAWRLLLVFLFPDTSMAYLLYASDARMDSILFGCILALAANPALDRGVYPSKLWTALGVLLLLVSFCIRNNAYRITLHYTLQGLALIPIFIFAICCSKNWCRWLNGRVIRFIGSLSYTAYLVHTSLLRVLFSHEKPHNIAVALAFALTLSYAYLINRLVERPLAQIRRRLEVGSPTKRPQPFFSSNASFEKTQ